MSILMWKQLDVLENAWDFFAYFKDLDWKSEGFQNNGLVTVLCTLGHLARERPHCRKCISLHSGWLQNTTWLMVALRLRTGQKSSEIASFFPGLCFLDLRSRTCSHHLSALLCAFKLYMPAPAMVSVCAWTSVSMHEHVYMCTCARVPLLCLLISLSVLVAILFPSELGYLVVPSNCMLESASNWALPETHLIAHPGAPSSRSWPLTIANFCSRSFFLAVERPSPFSGAQHPISSSEVKMKARGRVWYHWQLSLPPL